MAKRTQPSARRRGDGVSQAVVSEDELELPSAARRDGLNRDEGEALPDQLLKLLLSHVEPASVDKDPGKLNAPCADVVLQCGRNGFTCNLEGGGLLLAKLTERLQLDCGEMK